MSVLALVLLVVLVPMPVLVMELVLFVLLVLVLLVVLVVEHVLVHTTIVAMVVVVFFISWGPRPVPLPAVSPSDCSVGIPCRSWGIAFKCENLRGNPANMRVSENRDPWSYFR